MCSHRFATLCLIEILFESQIPDKASLVAPTSETIDLTSSDQPSAVPIPSALDVKPLAPLEVKPQEKEEKPKEKEPKPKKNAKAVKEAASVRFLKDLSH